MASSVTFAQLPEEEPALLAYLAESGDVWARAAGDDPTAPLWEPKPLGEFLQRFTSEIRDKYNSTVKVYLGARSDILDPVVHTCGVGPIPHLVDFLASNVIHYSRGEFHPSSRELTSSHLAFHSTYLDTRGDCQHKPQAFLKWANKVLSWVRRNTPGQVRPEGMNYTIRATQGVVARAAKGLKVPE